MKTKDLKLQSAKALASASLKIGKVSAERAAHIFSISLKCRKNLKH